MWTDLYISIAFLCGACFLCGVGAAALYYERRVRMDCSQCGQHAQWQAYNSGTNEKIEGFALCSGCKPGPWTAPHRTYYFRPIVEGEEKLVVGKTYTAEQIGEFFGFDPKRLENERMILIEPDDEEK